MGWETIAVILNYGRCQVLTTVIVTVDSSLVFFKIWNMGLFASCYTLQNGNGEPQPDRFLLVEAWKGRVSLRHMPARPRSKRWFLGWPERRSGSEWRIAKALDAKFIDPKVRAAWGHVSCACSCLKLD